MEMRNSYTAGNIALDSAHRNEADLRDCIKRLEDLEERVSALEGFLRQNKQQEE